MRPYNRRTLAAQILQMAAPYMSIVFPEHPRFDEKDVNDMSNWTFLTRILSLEIFFTVAALEEPWPLQNGHSVNQEMAKSLHSSDHFGRPRVFQNDRWSASDFLSTFNENERENMCLSMYNKSTSDATRS